MSEAIVVGLDVSKQEVVGCLLYKGQRYQSTFKQSEAGRDQLVAWIKSQGEHTSARVCLEATGRYSQDLARHLNQADLRVSVVNPYQIKAFAKSRLKRSKTDKIDAQSIAEFAQSQPLRDWTPPSAEWLSLQAMTRQLIELKRKKQRARNQLLAQPPAGMVQAQLEAEIVFYETQLAELKKAIAVHVRQFPELQAQVALVQSIKGIGEQTAWILIGEVRDWTAFADVGAVVAYAGLDPTQHQSGTVDQARGISKFGNAHLRAALYWPAMSARRSNPQIRAHSQRLADRGKNNKEQIIAAMRKLLHQVYGVLKSGQAYDPTYGMISQIAA